MKDVLQSFVVFSFTLCSRALTGFLHAYVDSEEGRIFALLGVSLMMLITTVIYAWTHETKRGLWIYLFSLAGRLLVNLVLAVEVVMPFNHITVSPEEYSFSGITSILIYSLVGLFVLQYLSTTCVGFMRKIFYGIKFLCCGVKNSPKKILSMTKNSASTSTPGKTDFQNKKQHLHPKSQFSKLKPLSTRMNVQVILQ